MGIWDGPTQTSTKSSRFSSLPSSHPSALEVPACHYHLCSLGFIIEELRLLQLVESSDNPRCIDSVVVDAK